MLHNPSFKAFAFLIIKLPRFLGKMHACCGGVVRCLVVLFSSKLLGMRKLCKNLCHTKETSPTPIWREKCQKSSQMCLEDLNNEIEARLSLQFLILGGKVRVSRASKHQLSINESCTITKIFPG